MLANPSFELAGSGGATFAGWNQFGVVGSTTDATHGSTAARVTGPNLGGEGASAYWQWLVAQPGERWRFSATVWHSPTSPLVGQSAAIVTIEWRDLNGDLISHESHTVADAATPPGVAVPRTFESGDAPPGGVVTVLYLGVLQAADDPPPDVFFDEVEFESLGPPTPEERQWVDFPGGRTIDFSGRTWRVKGPGFYGPGPNDFCDAPGCTWVDMDGRLHMTVQNQSGSWYSTEVTLEDALGYGDYIFTTLGRLDTLDPNIVFGLFLWQYGPCYDPANGWWNPYNEIDIEFSRWGNPGGDVAQYVAQPFDYPGNIDRFDVAFSEAELTSHAFRWLPDRVEFRSWRGGPQDESPGNLIHAWTYSGPHLPRPDQPRVHINLWQFNEAPSSTQEVVLDEFTFVPAGSDPVGVAEDPPSVAPSPRLSPADPSPFRSRTVIRFEMPTEGTASILVYDVAGRLVRTLARGIHPAGVNEVVWDGRDDGGHRAASGVYLYQLSTESTVESRRVILLR